MSSGKPFKILVRASICVCVPYNPKLGQFHRDYDAAFIKHQFQSQIYYNTSSIQQSNHPAILDLNNNLSEIRYHGELIHGKGTRDNPSVTLYLTEDLLDNKDPKTLYLYNILITYLKNSLDLMHYLIRSPDYGINISTFPLIPGKIGNNQSMVLFSQPLIVRATWVTMEVNGSTAILEAPSLKALIDHIQFK